MPAPKLICPSCGHYQSPGPAACESCSASMRSARRVFAELSTTRKCPHCAEAIQAVATVCRFCQRDVDHVAPTWIVAKAPGMSAGMKAALWIVGILAGLWFLSGGPNQVGVLTSREPVVELVSEHALRSSSAYMRVEGEVRNLTDQPIARIRAVVTWRTEQGEFITTDETMIDYDPLLPGQSSPFQVLTRNNPEMKRHWVEFRIGSTEINTKRQ